MQKMDSHRLLTKSTMEKSATMKTKWKWKIFNNKTIKWHKTN